jgi:hypothetical protein
VQVLQPGDDARLAFEAPDEIGAVGVLRQDDLDGDFTVNRGLVRPVDFPKSASADALAQFVTSYCLKGGMID